MQKNRNNEDKNRKTIEKANKPKSWFSKKAKNGYKLLGKLIKKLKKKTHIATMSNERTSQTENSELMRRAGNIMKHFMPINLIN